MKIGYQEMKIGYQVGKAVADDKKTEKVGGGLGSFIIESHGKILSWRKYCIITTTKKI